MGIACGDRTGYPPGKAVETMAGVKTTPRIGVAVFVRETEQREDSLARRSLSSRHSRMVGCVQTHHSMRVTYTLRSPIVAVPFGTTITTTLPSGASIEIRHNAQATLVEVKWQQRYFVVHLPDLLDACRVEDVGEIICSDGTGNSSAEAE
jgi:hypothetical protein